MSVRRALGALRRSYAQFFSRARPAVLVGAAGLAAPLLSGCVTGLKAEEIVRFDRDYGKNDLRPVDAFLPMVRAVLERHRVTPLPNENQRCFKVPTSFGAADVALTGRPIENARDITYVIFPGTPDGKYSHYKMGDHLGRYRNILLIDLPGHAWADTAEDFGFLLDANCRAIDEVLRQVRPAIGGRLIFYTQSTGALKVIHALAKMSPAYFSTIGLVDVNGIAGQYMPEPIYYTAGNRALCNPFLTGPIGYWLIKQFPSIGSTKMSEIAGASGEGFATFIREYERGWREAWTVREAFGLSYQEFSVMERLPEYQHEFATYLPNLDGFPVFFAASTADTFVGAACDERQAQPNARGFWIYDATSGLSFQERTYARFRAEHGARLSPHTTFEVFPGDHSFFLGTEKIPAQETGEMIDPAEALARALVRWDETLQ